MGELQLNEELIAEIAARLDLREPNRDAVQTLAAEVSQHYDVDEKTPPFEAVIDSATGVGKTYILTGALEYFVAANNVSDFVIITPGNTILRKTLDNFTPGHPKSLLGPMSVSPVVITAENFATPQMRTAMDDPAQIKVYIFTVQSLIKPESKVARKTHKFQEGLGTEFYKHLKATEQLVVFADEHHTYYGPKFSDAVRDLDPWVLVGLTATPAKKSEDQIIFRYPLSAAIADKLVKTPVIVGRKDDRTDSLTKLSDGVVLLQAKADAIDSYTQAIEADSVNPVMLVVAKDIQDADEYGSILRSEEFFNGAYQDAVLVIHSKSPDEALEALEEVEKPDSPVRMIISVGMLKEGWDVSNVYVIASMRSSVSEILTEQTLGRGMRLPFGKYTDVEILDTLEVVSHERYEELLKKAGVLNKAFIDYRTRAVLRMNAQGKMVVSRETFEAAAPPVIGPSSGEVGEEGAGGMLAPGSVGPEVGTPGVTSVEERTEQAGQAALKVKQSVLKRADAPDVRIPVLRMSALHSSFTLADITELDAFRKLGEALATNPEDELSRTLVSAVVVVGFDGVKRTQTVTVTAADKVSSPPSLFPLESLRKDLTEIVLASPAVPARKDQAQAVIPLMDAFFQGLGEEAQEILSANLGRAGARLVRLVTEEQRRFMANPSFEEVVELKEFNPTRATDKQISQDRFGGFLKTAAYEGWKRSMFPLEWFDSKPERTVANIVDEDGGVNCWIRLHIGELPILWNGAGQQYNPDLIVIEDDGTYWVTEVKMDKEMGSEDVIGKRTAAIRWANHVTADEKVVPTVWRYLLVSETDVETAKGSWSALKALGSG